MFEKISGFFKQFARRRKRQSGETTIMGAKEPGTDDFGLDDDFGGLDTYSDQGETEEPVGAVSAELDTEPGGEDAFSDFDFGAEEPDITTGGTDFDERTVSDEISGAETDLEDTEGGLAGAFDLGEEVVPFEEAVAEPRAGSPVKKILTMVIAAVIAIGVGAAFQMFAWPKVSNLVGMGGDEVKLDAETELNSAKRQETKLAKELAEFKKVGGPGQVQALKQQITETRDVQGAMQEFEKKHEDMKKQEAAYDSLIKKIDGLEADISKTDSEIRNIRTEIEQTRQKVVDLANQTKKEYERFRLELVRAEFGQRTLIELRMQDIESFRVEVAKLEERLSKLSAMTSTQAPTEDAPTGEAPEGQ